MRSASASSRCCSTGNKISDCTPRTRVGIWASGRKPAASAGRCGAGLAGGGCVRAFAGGVAGVGVAGKSPNEVRDGSVMSNRSIAFET